MSRLIVLSNRVKMPENNPMAGGLAVALQDVLIENSGIWMGWNGDIVATHAKSELSNNDALDSREALKNDDKLSGNHKAISESADFQTSHSKITYITTALTTYQYQHFYCGFANDVLWPLLHEQPDLINESPQDYAGYQGVNRLFAQQLKATIKPDDVIWVHDYHFLSVAYHCRQLGMTNRIGFFLHIPFAPLTFWQQLDKSAELIYHLAHYDVLGTQTQQDKVNSLSVFQHYLKDHYLTNSYQKNIPNNELLPDERFEDNKNFEDSDRSSKGQLNLNLNLKVPHCLAIDAYPIGVNVTKIQQQVSQLSLHSAQHAQSSNTVNTTAQRIIAVDRIDYSKGLLERFSAYRTFLEQYPVYQNQLEFMQIACPSRLDLLVYQRLCDRVRQTVNDVNQQFASDKNGADGNNLNDNNLSESRSNGSNANDSMIADINADHIKTNPTISHTTNSWQAITYSESVLDHEALMTAFWHSDIGWVNSLKDGMNLVAKEYIAAQNPDNPGVLLLSQYAGASEQMQAALIIDPHQPDSIIQGLKTALEMPLEQRKARYQSLLKGLQQYNLHDWQQSFLDALYDKENVKQIDSV